MLSIIIPMYNVENKINRTIKSISRQGIDNYELIVVDDCSTDNSIEKCEEAIEKYNIRNAKVIRSEKNSGPSHARNKGIELAAGDFCVMPDSDDYLEDNALKLMLEHMRYNSIVNVGIKGIYRNKIKNVYLYGKNDVEYIRKKDVIKFYLSGLLNSPANKIYDLKLIKKEKILFDEKIKYGEDLKFNLQYIDFIEKIININRTLYIYDMNDNGLNQMYKDDELIVHKNNFTYTMTIFNNNYDVTKDDEKSLYIFYLKERIRLYERYMKKDRRKNKIEYFNSIINGDNIHVLLENTGLSKIKKILVYNLIKCRFFFITRVFMKVFV